MTKPWLYYLICPVEKVDLVRDVAVRLFDGGEAERKNFSIAVTSDKNPDVIVGYTGCSGPLDDATAQRFEAEIVAIGGVEFFKCNNEPMPYEIKKASHAATKTKIGRGKKPKFEFSEKLGELWYKLDDKAKAIAIAPLMRGPR